MSQPIARKLSADEQFNGWVWQFWCIRSIEFLWDQWTACVITCRHGRYVGESRGLTDGMGDSLSAAFEAFRADAVTHDRED